jgi:hypothetical protein
MNEQSDEMMAQVAAQQAEEQARAAAGVEQTVKLLWDFFVGETVKEVFPQMGPGRTFKGMQVVFESGRIINVESWILESQLPKKRPEDETRTVNRPVLRIELAMPGHEDGS